MGKKKQNCESSVPHSIKIATEQEYVDVCVYACYGELDVSFN